MKGKLRLALCGFVIAALLLGASPVLATPVLPHAFYGTVAIDGNDAPVGSVVSAEVDGVNCGSYTIGVAGQYGNLDERDYLIVQGDIASGDTITFYINDVSAGQTETFEAGGGPTPLALTVPETAPTVDTNAASSVTTSRATLNGNLGSLGTALSVTASFEWGRTTAYGNTATTTSLSEAGAFSATLSGLSSGTTYHFQAKAVGDGPDAYGADRTFTTGRVAVGEGGVGYEPPSPPAGTTDVSGKVTSAGRFTRSVTATSEDELCTLTIPTGTIGLTEELESLDEVTILEMDEPPPPPKDAHVVGLAYDFGPDGATFEPAITITFNYDPADIPEDVAEEDLVIAYYDEEADEWVELEGCVVDTENKTITAPVSHFTTFAIVVSIPPPAPAAFSVTNLLVIKPLEIRPMEAVIITVSVANTGGTEGRYTVVLKINGVKEAAKRVTVAAGRSQSVSFSVSKEAAGTYNIAVDGLSESFTVVAPAPVVAPVPPPAAPPAPAPAPALAPPAPAPPEVIPPTAPNWPVIGGIIVATVILALLIFFLIRRRAY